MKKSKGFDKVQPKGFTLIELLIAITLVAIIASVGLVSYSQAQILARDARRKNDLRAIATAIELFYQQNKRFPCSGAGWVTSGGATWLSDAAVCAGGTGLNIAPNYINNMPKDPTSNTGNGYATSSFAYGYYSTNGAYGTCSTGTYYLLTTQLENRNDLDRLQAKPKTVCGNDLSSNGFGPYSLVLSEP